MTRRATILLAFVIALHGAPVAAGLTVAQTFCGSHASMIARLDMQYGESRRGSGLSGPQSGFEIWASDEPPFTWTILKVYPSGLSCLMASGNGWQSDPPVAPGAPT